MLARTCLNKIIVVCRVSLNIVASSNAFRVGWIRFCLHDTFHYLYIVLNVWRLKGILCLPPHSFLPSCHIIACIAPPLHPLVSSTCTPDGTGEARWGATRGYSIPQGWGSSPLILRSRYDHWGDLTTPQKTFRVLSLNSSCPNPSDLYLNTLKKKDLFVSQSSSESL